jgi:hypothetical protein
MVPKCELLKSILLHGQGLNYRVDICALKDHVGEKGLSSNWSTKFGFIKKNHLPSFPNCMLEKT